ncbi:MAG: DNA-formamidopyrimidine glycosylase family protein [Nibricoccus sp.]
MPELAEVEYYRKRWDLGLNQKITEVELHPKAKIFRGCDVASLEKQLTGATLVSSEAAAKQMLFRFSGDAWLGLHLGMTGELTAQSADFTPRKHDHLVLRQRERSLVFSDHRMFGRVQFSVGPSAPTWWTSIAPAILSGAFTVDAVAVFLRRRARAPIKAALLMQERFPGIGNWMADEILWRSAIHPKQPAGTLTSAQIKTLHRECRWVCREALKIIGDAPDTLPDPPKSWLFPHRWENGGLCPKTGAELLREEIGDGARPAGRQPGRSSCTKIFLQTRSL